MEIELVDTIRVLYKENKNKVKTHNNESTEFISKIGLKQGCVLSSLLFSILINDVINACNQKCSKMGIGIWRLSQVTLRDPLFAGDMILVAEPEKKVQ